MDGLPPLETLVGEQFFRLHGITSWEQTAILGRANLTRLVELAQLAVNALLTTGGSRDDLREMRRGIDYLGSLLAVAAEKPLLPGSVRRVSPGRPGLRLCRGYGRAYRGEVWWQEK